MKVWLNGSFVDSNETDVSLLSHSFSRGLSIFEVVDIVSSDKGPAFFGLKQHVDRFYNSARLIFMELDFPKEELIEAILATAQAASIKSGICKFFAYYPEEIMQMVPSSPKATIAIFVSNLDELQLVREELSTPINVGISSIRKNHPESIPPHAKITGNYVNGFLATKEIKRKGYDDAILLDTMGFVAEAPTSNLFLIKSRKIITPSTRSILQGITRLATIEVLREMNYIVEERDIRPQILSICDEAFFTNSISRVKPIRTIEGRKIGTQCPGPVTGVLSNRMEELFSGKIALSEKWLTLV